ncbi:ABC transporter permease subunit [Dactylosporangium sp. NPDC005555]|uniref:carbohydrate ABC transporter permease n=1 Tax=Dactylosporangium sp. NPDC005555 TaxID=3154889 RepID=UPI0033BF4315
MAQTGRTWTAARSSAAAWFLAPAVLLVAVLVLVPIGQTLWLSLHDAAGRDAVGAANYADIFTAPEIRRALLNNAIWIVVVPNLVTAVGLLAAVLAQRVRRSTAVRVVLFMPMAISLVSAGVTFRLVYDESPDRGVLNAVVVGVHDTFKPPSQYHGARARDGQALTPRDGGLQTTQPVTDREPVLLPLVGLAPRQLPKSATQAGTSGIVQGTGLRGVVWSDFLAVGGRPGAVDTGELGLPGVDVEVLRSGTVVARTRTAADGTFHLPQLTGQDYVVRLAAGNFTEPFAGLTWLGPSLVTPALIGTYIWIWAGFAMALVTAGLAAIPKETLEAARIDGAGEWQVLRAVTVPLMRPVLMVVLLTLTVNVLKVFDLVLVLAPESAQGPASVVALEMWRSSFDNIGRSSALGILLLVLALPGVLYNVHRLRRSER